MSYQPASYAPLFYALLSTYLVANIFGSQGRYRRGAIPAAYRVLDPVRYLLTAEVTQTCTAPILSRVIVESGHFCNPDPMLAHARQQDTVCLMTAMMAQPLGSEFSSLALARINEHHNKYGDRINSDTVLWLSWYDNVIPLYWLC